MTSGAERLAALETEYLSRLRQGETVPIEEYTARHPELADQIRARLSTLAVQRLGDFRIVRELGRGGMGVVYEAWQESLGRPVAIKVLAEQAMREETSRERFAREAKISARLHHTNIVPIFGTGEHDGRHFYVMQLIRGAGLDRVLAALRGESLPAPGPYDPGDVRPEEAAARLTGGSPHDEPDRRHGRGRYYFLGVARIGVQVAGALQYAHEQGTLHRDIKPANLLLDAYGTVWVTDFGLAKALEHGDLTGSEDIVGTLRYMSPEQTQGRYDTRSDIYSLGLTLHELASLQAPFEGEGRSRILMRVATGELRSLRKLDPSVPRDLATIIDKACARDPRHRYQSAEELQDDLQRFVDDRPVRARPVSAVEGLWRWCRRNRLVAGLAASTILAVLAAGITGWIGYGSTTAALGREQTQASRAEDNLRLSLQAFEGVFDRVSGPNVFQAVVEDEETGEFAVVSGSGVSTADVELLEQLLSFYGQFAERNADNADLRWEAARAHRRVGDIQQRLGDGEAAAAAYRTALELFAALPDSRGDRAVERARTHNQLGRVLLARGDVRGAVDAHREALGIIESGGDGVSPVLDLERARTHNLLGAALGPSGGIGFIPRGRGGRGRRGGDALAEIRQHHEAALGIVEKLLQEDPENPEYRLVEALSHRLLASVGSDDRQAAREHIGRAVAILSWLVAAHPGATQYRLELAETLLSGAGRLRGSRRQDSEPDPEMVARLREAVAHCEELYGSDRSVPGYAAVLARARFQLGRTLGPEAAEGAELMVQAWELQASLYRQDPTAVRHLYQLGFMAQPLARRLQEQPEQARRLLELVVLDDPEEGRRLTRQARSALAAIQRALAEACEALGDAAAAERARAQAARLRAGR